MTVPGEVARAGMQIALYEHMASEPHRKPSEQIMQPEPFPLHWPSSVAKLDAMLLGGCYGVTAIASEGKVGKSTLAIASALEAAATMDRQVVYFNAELSASEFEDRLGRYISAHPAVEDARGLFRAFHIARGCTVEEIFARCDEERGPEPVLVVLDSINTIATLGPGRDYFGKLDALGLWAMLARRYSEGAASFLIVSETNKAGGIKGEKLQFWADAIVRLKEPADRAWVEIEVTHSRRTPAGHAGKYLRHTPTASFREAGTEEIPKPRAVGAEGDEWWDR